MDSLNIWSNFSNYSFNLIMKKLFETIFRIVEILLVFLLIYWYLKEWRESWRQKKIIKFILMSIIPAICFWYVMHNALHGHPPKGLDNPYMNYDDCDCSNPLF